MTRLTAPSADATACWSTFGVEGQPLLCVDDCLPDPDAVVAFASDREFVPIGQYYPGVRLPVGEASAMALIERWLPDMQARFDLPGPPAFAECFLSLVTTAPGDLAPIQRLPHFDGVERERIAVLLYLDRKERGGTAFYRQRSTGYESVTADRQARYTAALRDGVERHGLPPARYIAGDTPMFERVHAVEGRFNRLIAYRGNALHCADLAGGFEPVTAPASGRLTLNLFLH